MWYRGYVTILSQFILASIAAGRSNRKVSTSSREDSHSPAAFLWVNNG